MIMFYLWLVAGIVAGFLFIIPVMIDDDQDFLLADLVVLLALVASGFVALAFVGVYTLVFVLQQVPWDKPIFKRRRR